MQNDTSRSWFTAKEAAAHIGVHLNTLYGYIQRKRNRPPFHRFSEQGRYRFPKDKFIEWSEGPQKKG